MHSFKELTMRRHRILNSDGCPSVPLSRPASPSRSPVHCVSPSVHPACPYLPASCPFCLAPSVSFHLPLPSFFAGQDKGTGQDRTGQGDRRGQDNGTRQDMTGRQDRRGQENRDGPDGTRQRTRQGTGQTNTKIIEHI